MIPTTIVVHHTATKDNISIDSIEQWHKAKFNLESSLGSFIGYHYTIDKDGIVYQSRRDNEIGAHCIPNDGKIGIALIGDFTINNPTDDQVHQLRLLTGKLKSDYHINHIYGHRDFFRTACPGDNLYKFVLLDKISLLQHLINFLKNKIYPHV